MTVFLFDQLQLTDQEALLPFVFTDCLLDALPADEQVLHFWQLQQSFILGMKDTKVPELLSGLTQLRTQKFTPIVRNSGGLGVVADQGVLNLSYIFKKNETVQSIDDAYAHCMAFIQQAFPELNIEAYEITQSYCPGTFDLSVKGKKIAGMAQRRIKDNIAVMVYLSVNGDQFARGAIAKAFYTAANIIPDSGYPDIEPTCMTTLASVLGYEISIAETKERLMNAFQATDDPKVQHALKETLPKNPLFTKRLANMIERNEQIKEE
ncbi:lipoate--protein ligase family protein [uncultured Enterococcus sp.]|uniref:lipoate--protein ligase family protein n=1 Tax=uncultured Enterococcus sp. TaxID=167972 RepID=UPI0025F2D0A4|nr:lipoate--protein ligase family protein [uncultured Enterococcus sp.]